MLGEIREVLRGAAAGPSGKLRSRFSSSSSVRQRYEGRKRDGLSPFFNFDFVVFRILQIHLAAEAEDGGAEPDRGWPDCSGPG